MIGWLGLLMGQFAWMANAWLLLAAVFLSYRRRKDCIVSVVLALVFSLHVWALFGQTLPGDEGGVNKLYLVRAREGLYCWLASMVVLLIGGCLVRLKGDQEVSAGQMVHGDPT